METMNDTPAEVKASSPIRTSLYEREGSIGGSLKRPSLRHEDALFPLSFKAIRARLGIPESSEQKTDIIAQSRSDDSDLCHEMLTTFGFTENQMHRAAERFHLGRSKSGKTIYWMIDDMGCCLDGRLGDTWVSTILKSRYPEAALYVTVKHCFFGLHQIGKRSLDYAFPTCGRLSSTHPDPLMGRGYHNVRATGGAVKPLDQRLARGLESGSKPLLMKRGLEVMENLKPIGIVESERSAVILSELCPELIWLAYSYTTNCTIDHFEPLQGRKITFYPRTDPNQEYYYSFLDLADQVKRTYKNTDVNVSSFLEDNASDDQKQRNIDLLEFMLEK